MRLMVLGVMGLIAGLGLAAAILSVPVMAEKGPLRATLVAHLEGAQEEEEEEVPGGGDPDGRGRAVVKVFKEQLCGRIETGAVESSSSKATIHLGMRGEKGPIVANLQELAATPLPGATTPTTTTTGTTGTTGAMGTTTPTTGTTTATTGTTTGAQTGTTTTTTTGETTLAQATTPPQTTTVPQTSPSQSTASPTASASAASASASASAASASASASAATTLEHTRVCVGVPRALSLELLEHPRRFYVNVTSGQSPEGAIRGQLHRSGHDDHRRGDGDDD